MNVITPEMIRDLRKSLEMTQSEFASFLCAGSYRTVNDWEAGKRKMSAPTWELAKMKSAELIGDYKIVCSDAESDFCTTSKLQAIGGYLALKQHGLNPVFYANDKMIENPLLSLN